MSGVRRFFADLLFGVLPDSLLCAMGDCDAALSTALSRLLTMPSAGSEKRVVASGSMFCCCTGMTVVAFVLTLSSLRVRSSNCCVGGAGGAGGTGLPTLVGAPLFAGAALSEALTSTGGRRYCQSLTASVDCRRCSSVNATDASAGRASTARAVRWARNAATPSLMPLQAAAMLGTSS